ncbi:hypothetical protein [Flavobacterium sp. XS2P14]|uniref:hypothetical protein n=2 Tax=Flavobacterium TaxID=237 RepID=UPI003AAC0464
MKNITKLAFIVCFTILSGNGYSQFSLGKMISKVEGASSSTGQDEERKNTLNLRGPEPPVDDQYSNYKSYEIKLDLSQGIEDSFTFRKIPYSSEKINNIFFISGLKKTNEGEFKIKYTVSRFESINDEDYVQWSYQKSPAYYIGMESNLEIMDKTGKVIYKRYTTPKVNLYVTDPTYSYEALVIRILNTNFYSMLQEFEGFYLYGPEVSGLRYFDIEKKKKSKSTFNPDEFNQSVQVLPTLVDVDRADWPSLFGEAQKYWTEFLAFEDKNDEDIQKKVRFSAYYNLATTNLLLGQVEEASKYFEGVKENEKSFLGMRTHHPFLVDLAKNIDNYKKTTEKATTLEAVQSEPILASYKKAATAFRYAEFDGEVEDVEGKVFRGKVRIISDFPEMVDYRTETQVSALRALANGIGSDKSTVRITIEGQKKPERTNLKKVVTIKDNEGHFYIAGQTGKGIGLTSDVNTKRYSLFEEIKKGEKISVFHEFFPQDAYVLKKQIQDEFFSPAVLIGRKKELREYFSDCPKMIENINNGLYNFENKETYIKMFEDYTALCGN